MKSIFALGLDECDATKPPTPFNVRLSALGPAYNAAVHRAIAQGWLDAYIMRGEYYVCASELSDLAGPCSDADDPDGGCYIPFKAYA